jgi:hypothetical protein
MQELSSVEVRWKALLEQTLHFRYSAEYMYHARKKRARFNIRYVVLSIVIIIDCISLCTTYFSMHQTMPVRNNQGSFLQLHLIKNRETKRQIAHPEQIPWAEIPRLPTSCFSAATQQSEPAEQNGRTRERNPTICLISRVVCSGLFSSPIEHLPSVPFKYSAMLLELVKDMPES